MRAAATSRFAYTVAGEGEHDIVLVPGFVSNVELAWQTFRLALRARTTKGAHGPFLDKGVSG